MSNADAQTLKKADKGGENLDNYAGVIFGLSFFVNVFYTFSSEASLQSTLPSHQYLAGTHSPESQVFSKALHVISGQLISSEPSKQSLSPSHTHFCSIQFPL